MVMGSLPFHRRIEWVRSIPFVEVFPVISRSFSNVSELFWCQFDGPSGDFPAVLWLDQRDYRSVIVTDG
jgi:hypothetical protein